MISKTEIWANVLFQNAQWTDNNKNGRIDADEIQPAERLTASERSKVVADIITKFIPLINRLDKNNDGLSFEEIQQAQFPKMPSMDIDLDAVIDSVIKTGSYDKNAFPVKFYNADTIPKQVIDDYFGADLIKNGAVVTKRLEMKGKSIGSAPYISKDVVCVVLIPGKKLNVSTPEQREYLKMILRHELVHAQQAFDGRMDERFSIRNYSINDSRVPKDQIENITSLTYDPLEEIEAHAATLREQIAKRDIEGIKKACIKVNVEIAKRNMGRDALKRYGADKALAVFEELSNASLSVPEIGKLNEELGTLTAGKPEYENKCRIYNDFDETLLNKVYTKSDLGLK